MKAFFKKIFISLFCIIIYHFSVDAQFNNDGIITNEIKTKQGILSIVHTKHLPKGKTILGTAFLKPYSEVQNKKIKQLKQLRDYSLKFGDEKIGNEGIFSIQLPDDESIYLQVFTSEGKIIDEISLELSEPLKGNKINIPKTLRNNYTEKITGNFSGDISNAKITIDEKPTDIIAGNESELFFEISEGNTGKNELEFEYEDVQYQQEINLIDYTLQVGEVNLQRGEKTYLDVKVFGLEDPTDSVKLNIENQSEQTITIFGGNKQDILIQSGEINSEGIWEKQFEIQSLRRGNFSIISDLEVIPNQKDEIETSDFNEIAEEKKENENIGNDEITRKKEVENPTLLNGVKDFSDENTKPCDSTTVNFHIQSEIQLISERICELGSGELDSLLKSFDDLEKATWKRDSLQGVLNTAIDFKSRLEQLKEKSVGKFQEQTNELNSMSATSSNCSPGWKDNFYKRFVASNPGSSERQNIYNRYVTRYEENFDKCKKGAINRLHKEKENQEQHFNENYIAPVNEKINQVTAQVNNAGNIAAEKKRELQSKMDSILQHLCDIDIKWNGLLSFMDANMICVRCGQVYFSKPPELLIMDSCLHNISKKIFDRIGRIKQPQKLNNLKAKAKSYFDLEKMQDDIDKLDSLNNAFNQLINSSGTVKMVHPCCERFAELASGVYLYGHSKKPYSDMASAAREYGFGNSGLIPVPADPAKYKDAAYKKEYRNKKRDVSATIFQIQTQVENTLRELKNGCNNGRNSSKFGLKDEKSMNLYGAINATPIHTESAEDLQNELLNFIQNMGKCYSQSIQNQRHRSYTQILHKCFRFKLCLEMVDNNMDAYNNRRQQQLDSLRTKFNTLKQDSLGLESALVDLKNLLISTEQRIGEIRHNIRNSENLNAAQSESLNAELNELNNRLAKLLVERNTINSKMGQFRLLLRQIGNQLNDFSNEMASRLVATIEECETERNRINNRRDLLERQIQIINEQVRRAEDISGEISNRAENSNRQIGNITEDVSRVNNNRSNIEAAVERRKRAERLRRLMEEKAQCLRLLSAYWDSQHSSFSPLDSLATVYEIFSGTMGNVPGGYSEIIDRINDFNGKIDAWRGRINQVANLLNGIVGQPSDSARASAFGDVLDIAGDIGNKVPGFGEMIGFYAKAYKAAIGAIMQLSQKKTDALKPLVDAFNVSTCPETSWGNKSLEQILDEKWNIFLSDQSNSVIVNHRLTDSEIEKLKGYFKQKITSDILSCCLKKISEPESPE